MPQPIDNSAGDEQNKVSPEVIAKLQEQIENLNKGIASYRDEAKQLKLNNEELQGEIKTLKQFKDSVEVEEDVKLNPEDEKKLESWAKQKGFVSQNELEAERQRMQVASLKSVEAQAISEFLEHHPEYDTDENWSKVLSEFSMYRQPSSLEGYKKVLSKIHQDFTVSIPKAKDEGRILEKIENYTKGRLSLSKGTQSSPDVGEKDIENLQKRYPSLSRDQIEEKLSEVRSLYPKK